MNDKFTIDFLYSQIKIMDKYEEALCNHSIPDKKTKEQCWDDFKAGQVAATQNYEEALYEIRDLQNRLANCQRAHLEKLVHDLKKRIAELEALVDELKPYRDGYDAYEDFPEEGENVIANLGSWLFFAQRRGDKWYDSLGQQAEIRGGVERWWKMPEEIQ